MRGVYEEAAGRAGTILTSLPQTFQAYYQEALLSSTSPSRMCALYFLPKTEFSNVASIEHGLVRHKQVPPPPPYSSFS